MTKERQQMGKEETTFQQRPSFLFSFSLFLSLSSFLSFPILLLFLFPLQSRVIYDDTGRERSHRTAVVPPAATPLSCSSSLFPSFRLICFSTSWRSSMPLFRSALRRTALRRTAFCGGLDAARAPLAPCPSLAQLLTPVVPLSSTHKEAMREVFNAAIN